MADFEKVYLIKFDTKQAQIAVNKLQTGLSVLDKKVKSASASFDRMGNSGARAGDKVSKGARKGALALSRLKTRATAAAGSVKKIGAAAIAMAGKMRALGRSMALWVTGPIALLGGGAIKMATDYEESLDKVSVVFGKSAKTVTEFTDNALRQFGLGKNSAIEMTSLFGDMAVGMKMPQEEAANLSIEIAKLAADTASLKNVPLGEIQTAFAGIFTGETESMKRIGVMLQQKNIQDWMRGKGIKGQIKDMKAADQAMIRFRYVQDTLSKAVGNFELTSGSAANKARTFQESLSDLGIVFGREMLPLFVKLIDKLSEGVKWFSGLSETTKEWIIIIGLALAAIGPMSIAIGGLVAVLQAVKVVLWAIIKTPIVAALVAIGAAAVYVAFNFNTLGVQAKGTFIEIAIALQELKLNIERSFIEAIDTVIGTYNKLRVALGKEPVTIELAIHRTAKGTAQYIEGLKEQSRGLDLESAIAEDKGNREQIMGMIGLPEGESPVSTLEEPSENKTKAKQHIQWKGPSRSKKGHNRLVKKENKRADIAKRQSEYNRLALMQNGSPSGKSGETVNNVTIKQTNNIKTGASQRDIDRALNSNGKKLKKLIQQPVSQ